MSTSSKEPPKSGRGRKKKKICFIFAIFCSLLFVVSISGASASEGDAEPLDNTEQSIKERHVPSSFMSRLTSWFLCGQRDCYDILGVPGWASDSTIRIAYRKLSISLKEIVERKNDGVGDGGDDVGGDGIDPVDELSHVKKAYKILINRKSRNVYDYYLQHENSPLALFFAARTNFSLFFEIVFAIILCLIFVSVGQIVHNNYCIKNKISSITSKEPFKKKVTKSLEESYGGKLKKMTEEEKKATRTEIEEKLFDEIAEQCQLDLSEIGLSNLAIFIILCLPFTILRYLLWNLVWFWRFYICGQKYGDAEKIYLTRKGLNLSEKEWANMTEAHKNSSLELELWQPSNLIAFLDEAEETERKQRLSSGKYRQQKRLKKKDRAPFNYNDD